MRFARERERHLALHHEDHALRLRIGFGPVAAAAGCDLHDVVREGLGETRERPRDDPEPRLVPVRQKAGDDVHHHALGDHRIGLGEDGAAGEKLGLRRVTAGGRIVGRFGHDLP